MSWGGPPVPGGYQTYSLEGDNDFWKNLVGAAAMGGGSDGGGGGGGSDGGGLMKPMARLEIGVPDVESDLLCDRFCVVLCDRFCVRFCVTGFV